MWADDLLDHLTDAMVVEADADRARSMAAYMKDHFAFYGIPTPRREAILKSTRTLS